MDLISQILFGNIFFDSAYIKILDLHQQKVNSS